MSQQKPIFSIMLEPGPFGKLKVSIGRNQVPLSPFSSMIPHAFRHLARQALSNFSQEADIIQFLNQSETPLLMHVLINKTWHECRYEPGPDLKKKCLIVLHSDQDTPHQALQHTPPLTVSLYKVAVGESIILSDIITLGDQLCVDLQAGRMVELSETNAWGLVDALTDEPHQGPSYLEHDDKEILAQKPVHFVPQANVKTMSLPHFLDQVHLILNREDIVKNMMLKENGMPKNGVKIEDVTLLTALEKIETTPEISIIQETGITCIKPVIGDGKYQYPLPVDLMEVMTFQIQHKPVLNKDHGIRYFLPLVKEQLHQTPSAEETTSDSLSAQIPDQEAKQINLPDTIDPDVKDHIRELLLALNQLRSAKWLRLHVRDKWYVSEVNIKREIEFLMMILERLPNADYDAQEGVFKCDTSYFSAQLSKLDELAKTHGIKLTKNAHQVEKLQLDIDINTVFHDDGSITATPTLSVQGKTILPEFIQELIQEGGLIQFEDKIQYLDYDTQALLKSLFDFSQTKKEGAKKQTEMQTDRLKIIDWFSLKSTGAKLWLPPEEEALYTALFNIKNIEQFPITTQLNGTLRSYQKEGVNWLLFLYKYRLGACLADDMGLGKTVQSIAFLATLYENKLDFKTSHAPSLIIVPPSLVFNWISELALFYPALNTYQYLGAQRSDIPEDTHVIVTTYDTLKRDIDTLKQRTFNVIIFDEAQLIKNITSDRSVAVRQLKGRFKCCLTGTPFENHLGEFYSILDLAIPGIFGSLSVFKKDIQNDDQLRYIRRARPFILRRTKESILSELPQKTEQNILIGFSNEQLEYYEMIRKQVKNTIQKAYETNQKSQAKLIALTALLRLRQVCVSPQLIDPDYTGSSPKLNYLMDTLEELLEEGHSALVFSQFRSFLDIFEKEVAKKELAYNRIDGTTPQAKRKKEINGFQLSEEPRLFLISLKTGGVGLNLTKASYVFHVDPWWNPQVENQASDRVHRIGQTQKVFINKLIMKNSIEEKIVTLKESKKELFDSILNKQLKTIDKIKLDAQDFLNLVA